MKTPPSRSLLATSTLAIAALANAQDLFVSGGNFLMRITPSGAQSIVTFAPGMVPITGATFEVDQRTNDLISAARVSPGASD